MLLQCHYFDRWMRLIGSSSFFSFTVNSVSQCFPHDRKTGLRWLARGYCFHIRPLQILILHAFAPDCCLASSSALVTHSGLSTKQHSQPYFSACDGQGTFWAPQLEQERECYTCSSSGRIGTESNYEDCEGQGER